MSQTLRDFIDAREAEVRGKIAELKSELAELRVAREAIDGGGGGAKREQPARAKQTIKEMIIASLASRSDGGVADEISAFIKEDFGQDVVRSSLSPQLSRLKAEGALNLDTSSNVWTLAGVTDDEENEKADNEHPGQGTLSAFDETQAKGREAVPGGGG